MVGRKGTCGCLIKFFLIFVLWSFPILSLLELNWYYHKYQFHFEETSSNLPFTITSSHPSKCHEILPPQPLFGGENSPNCEISLIDTNIQDKKDKTKKEHKIKLDF